MVEEVEIGRLPLTRRVRHGDMDPHRVLVVLVAAFFGVLDGLGGDSEIRESVVDDEHRDSEAVGVESEVRIGARTLQKDEIGSCGHQLVDELDSRARLWDVDIGREPLFEEAGVLHLARLGVDYHFVEEDWGAESILEVEFVDSEGDVPGVEVLSICSELLCDGDCRLVVFPGQGRGEEGGGQKEQCGLVKG